jgi:hypothetical protein
MNRVSKISLTELYDIKKKKENRNSIVFNHILEICNKKIKHIAEHGGMCMYYKIQPVIIGYPLYDYKNCVEYIMKQLRMSGLYVSQLPPPNNTYIYISWKLEDLSHKTKSTLLLQ